MTFDNMMINRTDVEHANNSLAIKIQCFFLFCKRDLLKCIKIMSHFVLINVQRDH